MNFHHLAEAIGFLAAGLVFYSYSYAWFPPARSAAVPWRAVVNGAAFGAIAVVLMIARIEIAPGVFVDPRVVPLALIGLFEGWPAALVSSAMAISYRLWMGGSGALAGSLTLGVTGLAAAMVHLWAMRSGRIGLPHALFLAGLAYAATVAGFASLGQRGLELFAPVWHGYLATVILGICGLMRLFRDVAEEHALTAAQRRYRESLDEASDVIRIIDADTLRILDTNRADTELTGYTREELLARTMRDFWPESAEARAHRETVMDELRRRGHAVALGLEFRTRSGRALPIDATYRLFTQQGRRYGVVIFHSAEARIAAEAAKREAAELRSVTLLARAAAHEVHNPLAVILGYLQLMRPRLPEDSKEGEWVRQMLDATGRIRDAVDRLGRVIRIESTPEVGLAPVMLDTTRSSEPRPEPPAAPPR